jgi:uncharacterized protein (DUF433 family)
MRNFNEIIFLSHSRNAGRVACTCPAVQVKSNSQQEAFVMSLILASEPISLQADSDGVVRVGNTRITLDTVVYAFREGATAEEIVQQYPSLQLGDVYFVLGYYLKRQGDVDSYLREREQKAAQVRLENETRFDPNGVRDRLLARQARQG